MSGVAVCRLAPSPTGAQHLGNARTFLIAYWSARAQNARLVLRIEDIDSPRVKPWATDQAIEDLAWLGIQHDGVPIIQTQRRDVYQSMLRRMIGDGRVYPCVCTRKDIDEAASAPHERSIGQSVADSGTRSSGGVRCGEPTRFTEATRWIAPETTVYPGTCSTWRGQAAAPDEGASCWRFRIDPRPMEFTDRIAGPLGCDPCLALGDFPVTRKEGAAAYQLAVVVDDIESGVTEVVRGDDLVASAFRQMQIYDYLNASPPQYAHVPLVVGADGRRLAKRHGDTRLSWYRDQGHRAESIVAWAAKTVFGHCVDFPDENATRDWTLDRWHGEMIDRFEWSDVNRERVVVTRWPDR